MSGTRKLAIMICPSFFIQLNQISFFSLSSIFIVVGDIQTSCKSYYPAVTDRSLINKASFCKKKLINNSNLLSTGAEFLII